MKNTYQLSLKTQTTKPFCRIANFLIHYEKKCQWIHLYLSFNYCSLLWHFPNRKFLGKVEEAQERWFRLLLLEAVVRRCSVKKAQARNFIKKETLAQVFSCEFCEISKNTFFHRTLLMAAFVIYEHTKNYLLDWTWILWNTFSIILVIPLIKNITFKLKAFSFLGHILEVAINRCYSKTIFLKILRTDGLQL